MNIKNIKTGVFFLLALISLSSCKDSMMTEITSIEADRAFSPIGLTATIVNQTGIKLTWKPVNGANNYTLELYQNGDFSGTPVKTITNITPDKLPYTITGLNGATQYSIRVKAITAGTADSKWLTVLARTDDEQIFKPVSLADITDKTVVLTWPKGEVATTITIVPGNITHTITQSEILAGSVKITGLVAETNYTAKMTNGIFTRGTALFKTDVNLDIAMIVNSVAEFNTALTNAAAGAIIALNKGDYDFRAVDLTATTININKSVSIVAAKASERPSLKNVTFKVFNGAAFRLKSLVVDGGATPTFAVTYDNAVAKDYGDLEIDACAISNYDGGVLGITSTPAVSTISSVVMTNNVFNKFQANGEIIDFRAAYPKKLTFNGNTLYDMKSREFIRMDDPKITTYPGGKVIITVSNNTLDGVANGTKRLFYVRIPAANHDIIFTKNIVSNTDGYLANQAATNLVTLSGNNYYLAPNMLAGASPIKIDAGGTNLNPGYKSVATGDFTISQETLKANGIGDPRWR